MCAVAVTMSNTANAVNACKDVKVKVENLHQSEEEIRIRKFKFTNTHKGNKTQTEDVRNVDCAWGDVCETNGNNLNNAHAVDLSNFQIVYSVREGDGDWSDNFTTSAFAVESDKQRCYTDKIYGTFTLDDSF